ncbi:MAG: hypothetical protein EOO09_10185 [Chitinophagaceae bacterium]|nr:MAG: hypothetical protein EOO09_10185 [Chitinophagaceae bacterium]
MLRLLVLIMILPFFTMAQQSTAFVYAGPAGNYVLLQAGERVQNPGQQKGYVIERSGKGDSRFTRLADFSPVQSYDAFVKMVGSTLAADFRAYIKAKTDADVIRFFNTTHEAKAYGFYALDINILRAMGRVYLDEGAATGYQYQMKAGSSTIAGPAAPAVFRKESLPRGLVQKIYTTDSLVSIRWTFPVVSGNTPLFARIYQQTDGDGKYISEPTLTTINFVDKGAYAMYESEVRPERLLNYYVVPVDFFGNEGLPSDTATAVSISYRKISGIRDIVVNDSMGGLFSRWKALPEKPWYSGIQVLRSRDARKDFIVIDSVAATATSYLDRQVLPNVTYYYKFRPLVYKLGGWEEITATTVHGSMGSSKNPPLAPKNFTADKEGKNIRLNWDFNQELDIFAYYVLRGTSSANMEIVSPAIMDSTWLDSTAVLSGRTNYVYSVLAMNNSQLKSESSRSAGITPARGEYIQAPDGITIRPDGASLMLTWPDIRRNDAAIAGYILYRKGKEEKEFRAVSEQLLVKPWYEDRTVKPNTGYDYTVSAVDRFGYESNRSPAASYGLLVKIIPPAMIYVRKLSAGVEVSWPKQNDAAVTGYTIYRKTPADKSFVKVTSVKPSEGFYVDKQFASGKLNIYAVKASTSQGESGFSPEKTVYVQ